MTLVHDTRRWTDPQKTLNKPLVAETSGREHGTDRGRPQVAGMIPRPLSSVVLRPIDQCSANLRQSVATALHPQRRLASDRYQHLTPDDLCQYWRNGVANLRERIRPRSRESEAIRERLYPGRLPHCEGPMFLRVDVPVAVLGDMGGDRAAQPVPVKPVVLVVEDVRSVAPMFGRQIRIASARCHEPKRFAVIISDRSCHVIPHDVSVLHALPSSLLERTFRRPRGQLRAPGRAPQAREITDSLTEGHTLFRAFGPVERAPLSQRDEDKPLTVLRYPKPPSIDETCVDVVAGIRELSGDISHGRKLVAESHVGNVLHQSRSRSDLSNDSDERFPELGSGISRFAMSFVDQ